MTMHVHTQLCSYVSEIPKDAYATLSQNLIGHLAHSQECCKLIGLYWKILRRRLRTLTGHFRKEIKTDYIAHVKRQALSTATRAMVNQNIWN